MPVYDPRILRRLREDKGLTLDKMVENLGISRATYQRIETKEIDIGLHTLISIAKRLELDIIDLISSNYENKDLIVSTDLKIYKTEDDLDVFLHETEKKANGRVVIFNIFPSNIYYRNTKIAQDRFNHLMSPYVHNVESYPIRSFINFGFSPCSPFCTEDKLIIIDKFIEAHKNSSINTSIAFIDDFFETYPNTAPECGIFNKINTVLITAPLTDNAVISIKSNKLVMQLQEGVDKKGIIFSNEHRKHREQALQLAKALRECLSKKENNINDFILNIKEKSSIKLYESILKNINPDISNQFKKAIDLKEK